MKRSITIETVMTYMYLLVVALSILFILSSIQNTDKRIGNSQKSTDIQIAFSYIDRSLRKGDSMDKIVVTDNPFEKNMKAIKIIKDYEEQWFFSYENNFYELHNTDVKDIKIDNAEILVEDINFNVYISDSGLITYYFMDKNDKAFKNLLGKYYIKTSKGV